MSMWDEPRAGYSSDFDQDVLKELVECNPHKSTWELALDLDISQSTICCYLKKIGKVRKLGIWLLHTSSEKNKEDCISIGTSLLSKLRNDLFLKNIITGDEEYIFYDNVQCKRHWIDKDESLQPTLKPELYERKVMLCVWWDHCGIIKFEFLNHCPTLSANLYSQQLHCVHENLLRKCPALVNPW